MRNDMFSARMRSASAFILDALRIRMERLHFAPTEHFTTDELRHLASHFGGGNTCEPGAIGAVTEHVYQTFATEDAMDAAMSDAYRDGLGPFFAKVWELVERKRRQNAASLVEPVRHRSRRTRRSHHRAQHPRFEHFLG